MKKYYLLKVHKGIHAGRFIGRGGNYPDVISLIQGGDLIEDHAQAFDIEREFEDQSCNCMVVVVSVSADGLISSDYVDYSSDEYSDYFKDKKLPKGSEKIIQGFINH